MDTIELFKGIGAIVTDKHFVYTSGRHGSVYVRKDMLFPHTSLISKVSEQIAKNIIEMGHEVDVVVGPAVCGIVISQWTAYHLSKLSGREVLSIFTEKSKSETDTFDKQQVFKRGYDKLVKDKNILVVEDLVNTGGSIKKVVDRVKEKGGNVVQAYVMVNRNPEVDDTYIGAPFAALAEYPAESFAPDKCPLCKDKVPVNTEVGHGKEFLNSSS